MENTREKEREREQNRLSKRHDEDNIEGMERKGAG
jgi:hypothetical protein